MGKNTRKRGGKSQAAKRAEGRKGQFELKHEIRKKARAGLGPKEKEYVLWDDDDTDDDSVSEEEWGNADQRAAFWAAYDKEQAVTLAQFAASNDPEGADESRAAFDSDEADEMAQACSSKERPAASSTRNKEGPPAEKENEKKTSSQVTDDHLMMTLESDGEDANDDGSDDEDEEGEHTMADAEEQDSDEEEELEWDDFEKVEKSRWQKRDITRADRSDDANENETFMTQAEAAAFAIGQELIQEEEEEKQRKEEKESKRSRKKKGKASAVIYSEDSDSLDDLDLWAAEEALHDDDRLDSKNMHNKGKRFKPRERVSLKGAKGKKKRKTGGRGGR